MSTIRYGTSVGPSRVKGDAREHWEEDEAKPVDDADPNVMMQCPYDQSHQIRACRFPFHILKCAKNHPKLASELRTCPFNAKHLVHKQELASHIEHCKDKSIEDAVDSSAEVNRKFHVPIKWTAPASKEDWEKESDDNAETFVWGVKNNLLPVNKSAPPVTNHLKAEVRAPRSFPWKF
ncbi:gametocyte-specific factor 1 [Hemibagrus wyckioides]|uniref:gametocyte-specific factor 1 n=1 Tax=Hemibagrus wyckioides TaxID=337641 RepID=UPI00266BD430|nr:gametocyte-specific factor 1 [Hemibagrus wyckioides]XP_058265633.1 gametocyte-specific factor 1 [Hemibagrus wyckioides]